jgi:hypothetical protein
MSLCGYEAGAGAEGSEWRDRPRRHKEEKYAKGSFCFLKRLQAQRLFVLGGIRTFLRICHT